MVLQRRFELTSDNYNWSGPIYGIDDYKTMTNDAGIILMRLVSSIPEGDDIYVSFNKATGINSGTIEGINNVMVHRKESATSKSRLLAKLNAGEEYSVSIDGVVVPIMVHSLSVSGFAEVQIGSTSPPTTQSPTVIPTQSPTALPTLRPTLRPTQSPTVIPTSAPTNVSTTDIPTNSPTDIPTTSNPTSSPTKKDLSHEDPSDVFFYARKGEMKTCGWLQDQERKARICKERNTGNDAGLPAKEVCTATCEPWRKFNLRKGKKSCKWLGMKNALRRKIICEKNSSAATNCPVVCSRKSNKFMYNRSNNIFQQRREEP
jgi:hypothetical protein